MFAHSRDATRRLDSARKQKALAKKLFLARASISLRRVASRLFHTIRISLVARIMRAEIEEPPAIVPFQRYLAPCQRHLRIRIKRTNVRPGGWRILLRIGQCSVVRV